MRHLMLQSQGSRKPCPILGWQATVLVPRKICGKVRNTIINIPYMYFTDTRSSTDTAKNFLQVFFSRGQRATLEMLGKGKRLSPPYNKTRRPRGGVEVQLDSFFNLGVRWCGWSHHAPGALPPGKTQQALNRRLGGPRAGLDGCEKSRSNRHSIPGTSRPQQVPILNTVSRPYSRNAIN